MSKRQQLKEQRERQEQISRLGWGLGILVIVLVLGYIIWSSFTAPAAPTPNALTPGGPTVTLPAGTALLGEAMTVDPDRSHIADENSDPGTYNSNPPTSGHHYPTWLDAGFYDTNTYKYPQGHLVHNLEHVYIIFWYNCKKLSDSQCSDIKSQIKAVMGAADNFKVIAYPWDSVDYPVVLTSWGYRLQMTTFDAATAAAFIQQHRNRSPEPQGP